MLTSAKKKMSSYVCMSYMDTYGKTGRNEDDSSSNIICSKILKTHCYHTIKTFIALIALIY